MLQKVFIVIPDEDGTEHSYRLDLDHDDFGAGDRIVKHVDGHRCEFTVRQASSLVLRRDGQDVRGWTLVVRLDC